MTTVPPEEPTPAATDATDEHPVHAVLDKIESKLSEDNVQSDVLTWLRKQIHAIRAML